MALWSENSKNTNKNTDKIFIFLLLLSSFVLFLWNLGDRSLWGSEGRWAEVVRQMFIRGDFFHPFINSEPYFDKPLFTYWAIAIFVPIFKGLNEFVVRLPSAISAIVSILCTYFLGTRLISKRVGQLASVLLLTSWGFIFWARTAAADLENLAFILLATCWYVYKKERTDFFVYLVFYLICVIGAQFKGLAAIAVPIMAVGIHLLLTRSVLRHLNVAHVVAVIIGGIIYLLPFLYAQKTGLNYNAEGLYLVFKENLVRFFNAFDHKDPFYCYFFYVPYLFLPWIFFLFGTLISIKEQWKDLTINEKWIYLTTGAIFLLFTASSSRRDYYILPILPFLALSVAIYLEKAATSRKGLIIALQACFIIIIAAVEVFSPILWPLVQKVFGFIPPFEFKTATVIIGLISLIPILGFRCIPFTDSFFPSRCLWPIISGAFFILLGIFCVQLVQLEVFRPNKPLLMSLKQELITVPGEKIAISKNMAWVSFYMDKKEPLINLEKPDNVSSFFLSVHKRYLISRKKDLKRFKEYFPKCNSRLLASAKEYPWSKRNDKGLVAYEIIGACK